MRLRWTRKAASDLVRLYDFLAPDSQIAAERVVELLSAAPEKLLLYPRLGERLEDLTSKEVRRLMIDSYELRYEVGGDEIIVLRLWHNREDR